MNETISSTEEFGLKMAYLINLWSIFVYSFVHTHCSHSKLHQTVIFANEIWSKNDKKIDGNVLILATFDADGA